MGNSNIFYWMFGGIFFAFGVMAEAVGLWIFFEEGDWLALAIVSIFFLLFGGIGGGIIVSRIMAIKKQRRFKERESIIPEKFIDMKKTEAV